MAFEALPQGESLHRWRLEHKVQERIVNLQQSGKIRRCRHVKSVKLIDWPYCRRIFTGSVASSMSEVGSARIIDNSVVGKAMFHLAVPTDPAGEIQRNTQRDTRTHRKPHK